MVALFFCISACCRVRSVHYFHQVKAIVLVAALARHSIPVEVAEAIVPNPVVEIVGAVGVARVGAIAPEPVGPSPAMMG